MTHRSLALAIAIAAPAAHAARDQALFGATTAAQPAVLDTVRQLVAIESGTRDAAQP